MKILIVCQYFYPESFRITDIALELKKTGHKVSVLTGMPNYPEGRFYKGYGLLSKKRGMVGGVHVRRALIVPRGKGKTIDLAMNYFSFIASASLSALRVHHGDYDVVFVYQLSPVTMAIPGIVAATKAHVPLVTYVVDLWPESLSAAGGTKNRKVLSLVGKLVDWIYRKSARVLVASLGFIEPIVLRGHAPNKLRYIPQYPEDLYRQVIVPETDPAREEMPRGFIVIFTGNIGAAQNLGVVVDAAEELAEYHDIYWVLIGDGRARVDLQHRVKARGFDRRILFFGKRPMARIPTYLSLADLALVCLSPEPLFALTLPAKIQSYFACGIPVVGSADGDAAQVIVESGAGLAGPAGDASALAQNVLAMYRSSPDERMAYANNALRYYNEHFRKERLIAEIELNLRQVVDITGGKP
jgi:glycosyltransferase involved in cell wall biosynthesis